MSDPHYTWCWIADSPETIAFAANAMAVVNANDKLILITQHKGKLYACQYQCPHAGAPLSNGYLDASGNIVCPLHHYKFNPRTGRNESGEGYFLKTYKVEVREEGVYVGWVL